MLDLLVHPDNARSMGVGERLGMRVVRTTRHPPTGWEVLVLRADRPAGAPSADGVDPPSATARADASGMMGG